MRAEPLVSVVLPVRLARKTVRNTLLSLLEQCRDVPAEVIAVVSERDPSREALQGLDNSCLQVVVAPGRQGVPQLRRDGVNVSRAPWVVITEDHCTFPNGWLKELVRDLPPDGRQIRGGPVENGRNSLTGWAQYFTRYSLFMPPVQQGSVRHLPGNNAVYARSVLTENAHLLREGFWEAEFNQGVLAKNCTMWMSPALSVLQHQQRGIFEYAFLRFRHGRCYGARRYEAAAAKERSRLRRNIPLIPLVLYARAARQIIKKNQNVGKFLLATPLLAMYFAAWAAGEATGYLFGMGKNSLDTD